MKIGSWQIELVGGLQNLMQYHCGCARFFFRWKLSSYSRMDGNIFQRQAQPLTPETNDRAGKPPTRLQKQAPRALDLDQLSAPLLPANQASALATIPFLSPLSVSPRPLPSEAEEFTFPVICGDNDKGREDDVHDAYSEARVWQHPAVASGYIEPSSLFTFFQSKCVLVDHAQS